MSQSLECSDKKMDNSKLCYLRGKVCSLSDVDTFRSFFKNHSLSTVLKKWKHCSLTTEVLGQTSQQRKKNLTGEKHWKIKEVYNILQFKSFVDSNELHLTMYVYLLKDIFKTSRKLRLKRCYCDSSQLLSAPKFSWEGLLSSSIVELRLLSGVDKLLFVIERYMLVWKKCFETLQS